MNFEKILKYFLSFKMVPFISRMYPLYVTPKNNFHTVCRLVVLLLLHATVTLGGEETVSSSPTPQIGVSHPLVNVTNSFVQQLSSPSSPVVLPVSLSISRPDTSPHFEDTSEDEVTHFSTSPNPLSGTYNKDLINPSTLAPANNSSSQKKRTNRKLFCSRTYAYLDKCLAHIPPIPDTGIPSTSQAVEAACKTFNMGMACVDEWTSKCLAKDKIAKFKASISGAHETFTFLCNDNKFRQEFLKYGGCYRRISHQWDECSKHFINSMKRYHSENSTIQCCVRLSFLQCVSEISHYHCNREAAKFLQRMAETLVRATMRTHLPPQCVSIHQRNCSILNFAPRQKTFSPKTTISFILLTILWSKANRSGL